VKYLLILIVIFFGIFIYFSINSASKPSLTPTVQSSPTPSRTELSEPIAEFKQRGNKKLFGSYITPQNSPIKPEKFTGFHTGIDIEYEDISANVPIYSIAEGQVIYSGHVNGYGGLIAIQYPQYIGIYGHLKPSSLVSNKSVVKKGDIIGILGQTYSTETDGERKHLHFAVLKGPKLDFRGYVQNQSELSLWIDPLTLFP
jgi:murein DD-endopeptidase MepM/ murein hydrolase activator NlpD